MQWILQLAINVGIKIAFQGLMQWIWLRNWNYTKAVIASKCSSEIRNGVCRCLCSVSHHFFIPMSKQVYRLSVINLALNAFGVCRRISLKFISEVRKNLGGNFQSHTKNGWSEYALKSIVAYISQHNYDKWLHTVIGKTKPMVY